MGLGDSDAGDGLCVVDYVNGLFESRSGGFVIPVQPVYALTFGWSLFFFIIIKVNIKIDGKVNINTNIIISIISMLASSVDAFE